MNIDVNNVIEKLKEIIGQQAVQIAILQAQIDEITQKLEGETKNG